MGGERTTQDQGQERFFFARQRGNVRVGTTADFIAMIADHLLACENVVQSCLTGLVSFPYRAAQSRIALCHLPGAGP